MHDPAIVKDAILRLRETAGPCLVLVPVRNPYTRWVSQWWMNLFEYEPTFNETFVRGAPVAVLHERFNWFLREGHALHSEDWLKRAFAAMLAGAGVDLSEYSIPPFDAGRKHLLIKARARR